MNTISSLDSKVVKAVARKESLKREMPLTKATGKSMYAGLSLPTNNGLDTEMTLVNSSSLLCYSSGTEITSSSASVGSNVDDEESSNILGGSVEEASPEGASDDSSIQDLLNIFSEIGKVSMFRYALSSLVLILVAIRGRYAGTRSHCHVFTSKPQIFGIAEDWTFKKGTEGRI